VIAGWALVLAAREMRLREMPVVTLTGLSAGQARMLRLALDDPIKPIDAESEIPRSKNNE
jgi:hypothetical protein